jgi:phosphoglycolate phosphatase
LNNKPLILFDLVSTLTQAGPRYAQAYIRMCQAWGFAPPGMDDILSALGEMNLKQIIATYTPGLPADNIGKFMSDCNQTCDAILDDKSWEEELYPHAHETLATLRDEGYRLGIYTGTRESAMQKQVAYHGLDAYFDADFMRGKDNVRDGMVRNDELKARQIAHMAANHGGPVIVVGDGMADLTAAKTAGVMFVAFAAGERAAALRNAGAVAVFDDYAQLPGIIAQLLRPAPAPSARPAGFSR